MTVKEMKKKIITGILRMVRSDGEFPDDRLTFINDAERLLKTRLREYNNWYNGDDDEILNFYTNENTFEYTYEPYFYRNKRTYFWTVSATEGDIKRTHSGIPRSIVDTIVNIVNFPIIKAGRLPIEGNPTNTRLQRILKVKKIKKKFKNRQLPLTLVEGWGCWKIVWDTAFSNLPDAVYYRAENVDFVYKNDSIIGVIFKDYYVGPKDKRYLVVEDRHLSLIEGEIGLIIKTDVYEIQKDGEHLTRITDFEEILPQLAGIKNYIEIRNCEILFAVPTILFEETDSTGAYGRSIFKGKISLFDDLDQACSQSSNAVRKSTPIEYFDTMYLEKDRRTGLPIQPRAYDRKYTMVQGVTNADGSPTSSSPVQVTQPNLNFAEYSNEAVQILLRILHGVISPATLGIDLAKKDNAEAQREKEKVTIFTRNAIIDAETDILMDLCNQLLCAEEFMRTGKITCFDYDVSVKFSEFADDSFENKLKVLADAYSGSNLSDEMYVEKLYGNTLSETEKKKELEWLRENHSEPKREGMMGAMGDGRNIPGTPGPGGGFDEEEL